MNIQIQKIWASDYLSDLDKWKLVKWARENEGNAKVEKSLMDFFENEEGLHQKYTSDLSDWNGKLSRFEELRKEADIKKQEASDHQGDEKAADDLLNKM